MILKVLFYINVIYRKSLRVMTISVNSFRTKLATAETEKSIFVPTHLENYIF